MAVWYYYWSYVRPYAQSFETLDAAMLQATYNNESGDASYVAIVDDAGREYDFAAYSAYMAEHHPPEPDRDEASHPVRYRRFRDQDWQIVEE